MMLDDATRARLEYFTQGVGPAGTEDVRDIIAAYEALLAERDGLFAELTDARSDAKKQVARVTHQWAGAQSQIAKLEAAQARAAPVLEAAERLATCLYSERSDATMELLDAVVAWRAAREG